MTKIKKETTVDAPVETVYAVWRNFENFPSFMENIEDVRATSDKMSHWKAVGPLGMSAEWDAEITLDKPNEAIGWRTVEGASSVVTAGKVNFKPVDAGRTHLDVTIEYAPPGGPLGDLVAKLFSDPDQHVEEDLGRFREIVERNTAAAQAGAPTGQPKYGGSMGGVSENDLADVERVAAGGEAAPRDGDTMAGGGTRG